MRVMTHELNWQILTNSSSNWLLTLKFHQGSWWYWFVYLMELKFVSLLRSSEPASSELPYAISL